MPVQTSYGKNMAKGLPGLVAWDFGPADITSVIAESELNFGRSVVQGTKARTGKQGATDSLGFAVRSILNVYAIDNNKDAYGPTEAAAILRSGYIWVKNEGGNALADGSAAYVNATGQVVDSAAAGAVAIPGTRVEIGGAIGAVVLLRVQTGIPSTTALANG